MAHKSQDSYRIADIRKAKVNGKQAKTFTAFVKHGDAFVHIGSFSAPARTANRDLWKIAADQGEK